MLGWDHKQIGMLVSRHLQLRGMLGCKNTTLCLLGHYANFGRFRSTGLGVTRCIPFGAFNSGEERRGGHTIITTSLT